MGSPLEPVLANIVLCHLERKFMENYSTFLLYYRLYVDDTFCVLNSYDEALHFCTFINTIHSNIRFTMEVGNAGKIQFLDTVIVKGDRFFQIDMMSFEKKLTLECI